MDEEEDVFEEHSHGAARFHPLVDIPLLIFGALGDLARAVANISDNATTMLAQHSNYLSTVDEFRDSVLREIEALPEDGVDE